MSHWSDLDIDQRPLVPWGPKLWMQTSHTLERREGWVLNDVNKVEYSDEGHGMMDRRKTVADSPVWSSKADYADYLGTTSTLHLPVLDVDAVPNTQAVPKKLEQFVSNVFQGVFTLWVPSSNYWHVYVGAAPDGKAMIGMTWHNFEQVLRFLSTWGVCDSGWVYYSTTQGHAVVRKPGFFKNTELTCMWCAEPFQSTDQLEEHEAYCG